MIVQFVRDPWADPEVALPSYETAGAAGADIRANFGAEQRAAGVTLAPGARALIPTGLRCAFEVGFEIQVRPRSGLALKHGITCLNTPGTIDADYRGPIGVLLINHGSDPVQITHSMRVAQIVIAPVIQASFEAVEMLSETARGAGGFGSTGVD